MPDLSRLLTDTASDDPAAALRAFAELRRELEREEEALVHRGRVAGLSWVEIAACLGVTKQAVHKKYAGRRWRRR
jgi:DNA-directed RNA polymerase specialized sigma24 family protein